MKILTPEDICRMMANSFDINYQSSISSIMYKLFVTLGIIAATNSFAQDNNFQYFKHETMESALKAEGLDLYATKNNNNIIQESSKRLDEIKKELGGDFGGSWIEYDTNNQATLVIGIAGNRILVQPKKYNINSNERIVFRPVTYGLDYLVSIQKKLADTFRDITQGNEQVLLSIGIDEQNNRILARGRKSNFPYIIEILQRTGFDTGIIFLEEQDGPITLMGTIYGGTKIGSTNNSTQSMYLCTTGFNVIIDNIYPGSITAAHCYNYDKARNFVHFNLGSSPTGSIKGPLIGEYFADGWPDAMDAAIFGNTNFVHTLQRQVITTGTNVANVKPLATASAASVVCTSGGSNGWRCGTISRINSIHQINSRDFYFNEFSACGGPGDSGGPVVSQQFNALGIYVGAVGNNNQNGTCGPVFGGGSPAKSVYQPLGPYLAKYNNVQIMAN